MGEHMLFKTGIRRLGSNESSFFYRYPDIDKTVREVRTLTRIKNLKVPPAWEEARIARSPSAKFQAIGYDSAGRLRYLYHPRYRERKEREKFERILRFSDALPQMRRITSNHLHHK
jgi:DNA topoisomerase-1